MIALAYRKPYDWNGLLDFLRPRAIAGVEMVTDDSYEREGVRVTHDAARNAIIASDPSQVDRVRTMFDVDADITAITKHFARDTMLRPLMKAHPGIRVPGTWDPFEMAIRAIVGQQISVAGATTLMARLAARRDAAVAHAREDESRHAASPLEHDPRTCPCGGPRRGDVRTRRDAR